MTLKTPKSDFRRYIEENQALPPDCVLGDIAWYSVEEAAYDAAKIEAEFARLGLDPAMLPAPINPTDAFEKATMVKNVHGVKYDVAGGYTAEIMVREVARDANSITRHMIREVKDSAHKTLRHEKVGEFVFYKPVTRNGKADPASARARRGLEPNLSDDERALLTGVLKEFDAAYVRFRDFHDAQKLRGVMRSYLTKLNAIQMKPSVYFVHASRRPELLALQEFASGFPTMSLTLLPLADLPGLRQDVTDAFQREAVKELELVVTEIAKYRNSRAKGITTAGWVKLKSDYDRVMAKANEYSRHLKVSQDQTAGAAEAALLALQSLQNDYLKQLEATS